MSKRLADGLQGGSDRMHEFGMMGTPEEKPQRATAAQLANRKSGQVVEELSPTNARCWDVSRTRLG
ncbi:uncharacterized protein N7496_002226 [Penicillium cataractarum]|uniref:Uncharacterized protein n=1 Tax=Penicillium cataractarum TaxID=2100454 RepID=A0A9W9SNT6_9EURO|nr:uncharacterized protein N7496_002226 [Penicillium cataractarum]KAJ5379798.1 hypothetical protein N7496_002226 [Penicillium cataractarum]